MSATKKNALGRGLSALLENAETDVTSRAGESGGSALRECCEYPIIKN